ncbi:thiosulfate sulfurtransferase activity [Sparganum proliferum]
MLETCVGDKQSVSISKVQQSHHFHIGNQAQSGQEDDWLWGRQVQFDHSNRQQQSAARGEVVFQLALATESKTPLYRAVRQPKLVAEYSDRLCAGIVLQKHVLSPTPISNLPYFRLSCMLHTLPARQNWRISPIRAPTVSLRPAHTSAQSYGLSPSELKEMVRRGEVMLIDVRTQEEIHQNGRIEGSVNIPFETFRGALDLTDDSFCKKYGFDRRRLSTTAPVFICKADAEDSRSLQYVRVRDPVLPSRLPYSSKTAEMEVLEPLRLLLVYRPGPRSIQQSRLDDDLVHLQFGVEVETGAIPDCDSQTADGLAGFGDPTGYFIVILVVQKKVLAR